MIRKKREKSDGIKVMSLIVVVGADRADGEG